MLSARDAHGRAIRASTHARGEAVLCPTCGTQLFLRVPNGRVPHFTHPAHSGCGGQDRPRFTRRGGPDLFDEQQAALFDLPDTAQGPATTHGEMPRR